MFVFRFLVNDFDNVCVPSLCVFLVFMCVWRGLQEIIVVIIIVIRGLQEVAIIVVIGGFEKVVVIVVVWRSAEVVPKRVS